MPEPLHLVAGQPPVSTGEKGIQWKPIASPVRLRFTGTSYEAVGHALIEAFGPFPIRLNAGEQLLILRGMAAAAGEGKQPYQELIQALSQVGELELTDLA